MVEHMNCEYQYITRLFHNSGFRVKVIPLPSGYEVQAACANGEVFVGEGDTLLDAITKLGIAVGLIPYQNCFKTA